jgi:hypothetical protein
MRVAKPIVLEAKIRRRLEQQARGRSTPVRVVLLAAEGFQKRTDCGSDGDGAPDVARWRDRFLRLGIPGLLKDAARPGRTPSIPAAVVAQVIEKTTQSTPQTMDAQQGGAGNYLATRSELAR